MFAAATLLAFPLLAFAIPSPTTPGSTDVYAEGGQCTIAWGVDTTGKWTAMDIELMTGNNNPMTHMRTIATVDATKTSSYSWACPAVDLHSTVYFYQFSSSADLSDTTWSTRFLITAADGTKDAAPSLTASNGALYGFGSFTDPTQYNAQPSYFIGNGQLIGGASNSSSSSSSTSSSTGSASAAGSSSASGSGTVSTGAGSSSASVPAGSASNSVPGSTASGSSASAASGTGSMSRSVVPTASGTLAAPTATGSTKGSGAASSASVTSWVVLAGAALFGAVVSSL